MTSLLERDGDGVAAPELSALYAWSTDGAGFVLGVQDFETVCGREVQTPPPAGQKT